LSDGRTSRWRYSSLKEHEISRSLRAASTMHYRVFYLFERSGESVSSASAVEMSAKAIREQLLPRLHSEDDFLGLIDVEDNVLQILLEPDRGLYWVELPMDAAKASYGRHMELEELKDLLARLPPLLDRRYIPGLEYRPW
jgi:hypothetical protein